MKEEPIFKKCGQSFIPLIQEVLHRLLEDERLWIKANVRFTQRSYIQRSLEQLALSLKVGVSDSDFRKELEATYKELLERITQVDGSSWKHGRFHYIRLHPRILDANRENALFVIAHELGHCFNWKPIKGRLTTEIQEQRADEWAFRRGFTFTIESEDL
jgi:hypothetical protein